MFVGHGMLAFALVAAGVRARGSPPERALALGLLCGAFATLPDVDMAYAVVGVVTAEGGPLALAGAFWSTGNLVHRAVTHSLVVAPVAAAAVALWVAGRRSGRCDVRVAAVAAVAGLVAVAAAESGPLGGVVMGLFGVGALGLGELAVRRTAFGSRPLFVAALVGFASHPLGDLFTGEPPALLYPFETTVLAERIALHPDPTLHLLSAFAVELATLWLAAAVVGGLYGVRPRIAPRASLGTGYAASVLLLPAPTLELSYPFVCSVLAVGALGVLPLVRLEADRRPVTVERPNWSTAAMTGLSTVTVALLAYTTVYLVA